MRTHALRWLTAGILAYLVLFPTLIRGHTPASKSAEPTAPSPRWITHGRSPGGAVCTTQIEDRGTGGSHRLPGRHQPGMLIGVIPGR